MKRSMKMALADAEPHGLSKVHGGYKARDARGEIYAFAALHSPQTIRALHDRALLDFWGPEKAACLTQLGSERLEELRAEAGQ
ncbi:hypothetical protein [Sediminimonas qiaohouensis]|uniref:hypothetical protein n=1 Tax=Sediminimonas qiaohouensis TaxID=552061 RepID=UPI0004106709|nr:hypothetical protein [Sediminimonas qiaohouensis]